MQDSKFFIRTVVVVVVAVALFVKWLRIPRCGDRGTARDRIESGAHGFVRLRGRFVRVSNGGQSDIAPGDHCRVVHATGRFIMVVGPREMST